MSKTLWFETKAEKTLQSVNAAFDREANSRDDEIIHFKTLDEILVAEKAGYMEFKNGVMKVYV